ncbi:hypothetical protein LRP88_14897 [Fusarium phalaenopsidis]
MAEAVGLAASVIAIISLSTKVTRLCSDYSTAVRNARADITRLQSQLGNLGECLQGAQRLLNDPKNRSLATSQILMDCLDGCTSELVQVQSRLDPGKARKAMGRFGLRALRWPFDSKEVNGVISNLGRCIQTIILCLQIDQTTILLDIQQKFEGVTLQPRRDGSIARKPCFCVQFDRDPDFIDRPDIITWLREQYKGSAGRMALAGMGGFGYGSPQTSVFWDHAKTLPDALFIDKQPEIQWSMRQSLIDFLVEAHACFALLPETLFLTVNLLDRYCSKRVVYKQHYQLVGCVALLIAAKYGDKNDRIPQIHELSSMCCGLYDARMFTQMEMHVLNTLDWVIGHPSVDYFARLMFREEGDNQEIKHMAAHLCETAPYHGSFVSTKPSIMARSSRAVARAILARPKVNDGENDPTENTTLLALSHHLRQPSATLACKCSTRSLSGASQKLAEFIAEQADVARQAADPTTPRNEPINKHTRSSYSKPRNGHSGTIGLEGYPTPPTTPGANCKDCYISPPHSSYL